MSLAVGLLITYLAGSFPTAYLVGRAKGVDLGRMGSGNYGATNVFRNLGRGPASLALVVDVAKGYLPVELLPRWLSPSGIGPGTFAVLLAVAAVLGHVFSIFLRFRGGKGVGTAAGAFLALSPVAILLAVAAWVAVLAWRRIVSLASLAAALVLLAVVAGLHARDWPRDWPLVVLTASLCAFVFWTHRENIGRLLRGKEKPIVERRGSR
ncbi:MAG TPA: glycerol-3-phosphate 1-O-acyltransferase PlsY [Gemmatimonadota bacterium]|nr:glycerol-3-phosphate 1-O-acyltransferase PlsY [Gemmatimonadota bacterium]